MLNKVYAAGAALAATIRAGCTFYSRRAQRHAVLFICQAPPRPFPSSAPFLRTPAWNNNKKKREPAFRRQVRLSDKARARAAERTGDVAPSTEAAFLIANLNTARYDLHRDIVGEI